MGEKGKGWLNSEQQEQVLHFGIGQPDDCTAFPVEGPYLSHGPEGL
jgi:hypothetical protein